ncbi:uncharacterized protein BCR38DRAFT_408075 [Pseudomassariella vexata]|uniref:Uncharacterized protein n=1 Tax=Pseudomassariella vexata TaxID=1141098 RepID=A0A1Y2E3H4_9PEZI|nr:uncharacterized protein BCR38DRAFT_408075 [Pseudomassariella vexata]ORY66103.1 hypothetical protein BCR38DRAFT_408075 [Pseudomassariella vexata]
MYPEVYASMDTHKQFIDKIKITHRNNKQDKWTPFPKVFRNSPLSKEVKATREAQLFYYDTDKLITEAHEAEKVSNEDYKTRVKAARTISISASSSSSFSSGSGKPQYSSNTPQGHSRPSTLKKEMAIKVELSDKINIIQPRKPSYPSHRLIPAQSLKGILKDDTPHQQKKGLRITGFRKPCQTVATAQEKSVRTVDFTAPWPFDLITEQPVLPRRTMCAKEYRAWWRDYRNGLITVKDNEKLWEARRFYDMREGQKVPLTVPTRKVTRRRMIQRKFCEWLTEKPPDWITEEDKIQTEDTKSQIVPQKEEKTVSEKGQKKKKKSKKKSFRKRDLIWFLIRPGTK